MPENQTTAHETELRITSNGKSLDVDYTLEDLPLDFNIKGNTLVNPLFNMKERNNFYFNDMYQCLTVEKDRFRFYNSKNISRVRYYCHARPEHKTKFKPETYYTVSFYVRKNVGAMTVKMAGSNTNYIIPQEEGYHSYTFYTNQTFFNDAYWFIFDVTLHTKEANDPIDEFDIEILSFVEGEIPYFKRLETVMGVGVNGGLEITTQSINPILGEYQLQGDIPSQLEFIENEIDKQVDEYKISWI